MCGGVSYLRCVTGIWVDFMEITKGKWSCHQSLGFSKMLVCYHKQPKNKTYTPKNTYSGVSKDRSHEEYLA